MDSGNPIHLHTPADSGPPNGTGQRGIRRHNALGTRWATANITRNGQGIHSSTPLPDRIRATTASATWSGVDENGAG